MPVAFPHVVTTTRNVFRFYQMPPDVPRWLELCFGSQLVCHFQGTRSGSGSVPATLSEPLKHVISVCGYLFTDDQSPGPKLSFDTHGKDTGEGFPLKRELTSSKNHPENCRVFSGFRNTDDVSLLTHQGWTTPVHSKTLLVPGVKVSIAKLGVEMTRNFL